MVAGTKLATTQRESFASRRELEKKMVLIHTGGVDAMRRLSKSAIPCSLATRVSKADAKHQGLAMALAELPRESFGESRSHEAHGELKERKKKSRTF